MPSYRHHDHGNLYVLFDVKFPDRLGGEDGEGMSEAQIAALESVLPPRSPQNTPPENAMTEDYNLDKVDTDREAARAQATHMEDEDDEMGGGGGNVQCQSQ